MRTVFTLALVGASVEASYFPCGRSDYQSVFKQYARSFQQDVTDLTTDCYGSSDLLGQKFEIIGTAFSNVSMSNFMDPIIDIQNMLVEFANLASNCNFSGYSEQLLTRTTEFSGLFNVAFTAGYGIMTADSDNKFYAAYNNLKSGNLNCDEWSFNVGQFLSATMNFMTPDQNYAA